jgi:hypothetical protein
MKRDGGDESVQRSKHSGVADFNPKRDSSTRQLLAENRGEVEGKTCSHNEIDRIGTAGNRRSISPGCISASRRRDIDVVVPNQIVRGSRISTAQCIL